MTNKEKKSAIEFEFVALAAIVLVSAGVSGVLVREFASADDTPYREQSAQVFEAAHSTEEAAPAIVGVSKDEYFGSVPVTAKAVVVYDIAADEILYAKGATQQLPLASITKLLTVYIAHTELSEATPVTISKTALATEGESGFSEGEVWRLGDLADFTLLTSSNDGAAALAEKVEQQLTDGESFSELMNVYASSLGMSQSYFLNPTGLDHSLETGGGYGSARDVTKLLRHIYRERPAMLSITRSPYKTLSSFSTSYDAENTNMLVGEIPGLIASKTGFTDLAGGNLAIVFDTGIGREVAIVVLGSTWDDRFVDALTLAEIARDYVRYTQ